MRRGRTRRLRRNVICALTNLVKRTAMHDSKQPPPFAFPGKDERQTHRAFRVAMTAAALLVASLAFGQDFPSKPIRMITVGTGGTADFVTRLLAQGVTTNTGAQVVVD